MVVLFLLLCINVAADATYPYVGKWRGFHGHAVGLCTAELVAPEWVVTAGHCAVRLLEHETVKVHVTFEHSANKIKRGVTRCLRAPASEDLAICQLTLPVSRNAIIPVGLSAIKYTSAGMHLAGDVMCVGTYGGMHVTGPKVLEYEASGAHLYVNNTNGSGMHAGDSGGAWVSQVHVNVNVTNGNTTIVPALVGVIHGGEGKKGHKRGVAVQPSFVRGFIDNATNYTVTWITPVTVSERSVPLPLPLPLPLPMTVTVTVSPGEDLHACVDSAQRAPTKCILLPGIHYASASTSAALSLIDDNGTHHYHLEITSTDKNTTVLTGLTPLHNANWSLYSGNIYRAEIPAHMLQTEQLFMDNSIWMSEARYPNLAKGGGVNGVLELSSWAFCGKGSKAGTCVDRKDRWSDLTKINESMKGALATLSLGGRYATYTRTVKTHRKGSSHFTYNGNLGPGPGSKGTGSGNRYWLSGKLSLLDSPGEWYIDTNTSSLFVWMPDGAHPSDRLSLKTQDFCVDYSSGDASPAVAAASGILVSNVTLLGCTIRLRGCDAANGVPCIVRDVNVTFPSYHRHIHLRDPVAPFTKGPPPNTTLIQGDGVIVERVSIRWSNSVGIKIVGSHNFLEELLIEDVDWLATLDYPPLEIGFDIDEKRSDDDDDDNNNNNNNNNDTTANANANANANGWGMYPRKTFGINNTVLRATVRNFGNAGIVTSQLSNEISFSHVYNGGLLGSDDACVHADNSAARCGSGGVACIKTWHHNHVHDCLAKCMRGDDNTQNLTMHHNVIFNCGIPKDDGSGQSFGVVLKGDANLFYSNTVFATKEREVALATDTEDKFHLKQSNVHSVVFNNAAHLWSGHGGPNPLSKSVHFKFGPEGQYTSGAILSKDFVDKNAMDFTPRPGSPLMGKGVAQEPWVSAPKAGAPPLDAGAYQTGEVPWKAGCTFVESC